MIKDKIQQLFPYFALELSKKLDPVKYGNIESYEQWQTLINKNPKDAEIIIKEASKLSDEDWLKIEEEYNKLTSNQDSADVDIYNKNKSEMNTYDEEDDIEFVKKGAKLKKLQSMKKGKKVGTKKCSCGCDMISGKAKGGKLIYKCSCGCGAKNKENEVFYIW